MEQKSRFFSRDDLVKIENFGVLEIGYYFPRLVENPPMPTTDPIHKPRFHRVKREGGAK